VSDADELPRAHGPPPLRALFKHLPEDFVVEERLAFAPSGDGEHAFLHVEKRGANTEWVARQLARIAGVAPVAIGYAGLKDRHALTRQYFSVHLPGRTGPDWLAIEHPEFRVLAATRHWRKLPRGALSGNRFTIVLREARGDRRAADARIAAIAQLGVPNYFGEQRFGRDGANLARARAMFGGERVERHERSLLLSAARSALFNAVLAARVLDGTWNGALEGDVFQLDGSNSIFGSAGDDPSVAVRCAQLAIHPTGPLWGRGPLRCAGSVATLERRVGDAHAELAAGLEAAGLEQERRALRLPVRACAHDWPAPDRLHVRFELRPGAYATVVLREVAEVAGERR
jgi:tRNA pseudouridine13 synthase